MAAPDRLTGLPVNQQTLAASIPTTVNQTENKGPQTSTQTGGSAERASNAVSSSSSSINTTPGALSALDALIAQLTTRPDIDQAQLEADFPPATRIFSPQYGWYWQGPNGQSMSQADAQRFNQQQEAKKQIAIKNAPIIQGGTPEQKNTRAQRDAEIARNRDLQNTNVTDSDERKAALTQANLNQQSQLNAKELALTSKVTEILAGAQAFYREQNAKGQGRFSEERAKAEGQALIDKAIADALEAALPQITQGLEGAGTSKSTIAANLTQKAATKGATEGAALSANLGVQYGQLSNQLTTAFAQLDATTASELARTLATVGTNFANTGVSSNLDFEKLVTQEVANYGNQNVQLAGVLEALTRSDPNSPEAMLIQAIAASKGLVSSGTQNQVGSTNSDKSQGQVTNTSGQQNTTNTTRQPTAGTVAPVAAPGTRDFGMTFQNSSSGMPNFFTITPGSNQDLNSSYDALQSNTADALFGSPVEEY